MNPLLPATRKVAGAGLDLAFREWNSDSPGLPMVLLHGITGSSEDWARTAVGLPGRRLIGLDARGHGASDWDPDEDYSVDMHFADVSNVLAALGIERCILAGFSMGGGTAIATAACLPEAVAGLAVIDAYPFPDQTTGSARIARWVSTRASETRSFDPAIARRFRELLAEGRATRADLRPMWEALRCPAVVVRGEQSSVLPRATADEMIATQPRATLATVPDVSHAIPLERPRELAAILAGLARHVDPRAPSQVSASASTAH